MPREPIATWCFAVVVVRRGSEYLLVHEKGHDQAWYLPAGRVERGETFEEAALRETLEETGVPICLVGLLRVEFSPRVAGARLRVVYLGEPVDDALPKAVPDEESLGACWVPWDRMSDYPLRDEEVVQLIEYVEAGGTVYPLTVIQSEGMPYAVGPT